MLIRSLKSFKFGLFEIIVLCFFILLALSAYFFLFRTRKELTVIVKTSEESIIRHPWENDILLNSTIWLNNLFHPGMKEKDTLGKPVAELLGVRKYDTRPESPSVYLTLKLKAVYTLGTKIHTFKGKNVLVGSTIQLVLDEVFVEGIIVKINNDKQAPTRKLLLRATLANPESGGVLPYYADGIPEGAQVQDSNGKVILTIVKKELEPAKKLVNTAQGEINLATDPLRKDVFLTLEVLGSKVDNRYYFFDNIPILVGESVPIHLPNMSFYPTITSLSEVK